MPTHKAINTFIRNYNKEFAIKGYSKMTLEQKMTAVKEHINKISSKIDRDKIKTEYTNTILKPFKEKAKTGKLRGALGKKYNVPKTETKTKTKTTKMDADSLRNMKDAMNSLNLKDLKDVLKGGVYPTNQRPLDTEVKEHIKKLIIRKSK